MAALPGPVDYLQPEFEGAARGTQTSLPVDFLCYDTQYRVIIEKPAEIFRREVLGVILLFIMHGFFHPRFCE